MIIYTAITTGGSSPARTPMGTLCVVSGHIVCLFPLFSIFILSQCTLYCYAICQIKYYHTIPYHVMHFRICCATILLIFCPLKRFVMHRHTPCITYYTQSTMQDLPRGGNYYYFFLGGGACNAWHNHSFARGVRGHASPKKII